MRSTPAAAVEAALGERPPLAAAVVTQAVQHIEATGPLDDAAELQRAFATRPTRAAQVRERAWLLGERLGLPAELARWRHLAVWTVLGLALLVALAALATARAVLAPDRSINAVAAFVSLLGWHALMLLLWLGGLLWSAAGGSAARALGGFSLGRAALGLAARLPLDRGPHALTLLRAATAVLTRARLWPWLTGLLSHTIWALAFAVVLALLAFGFAFHAYRLSWETTILSADFFQRFVQATGALPGALGFPVPDAAAVQRVGNAAGAQAGAAAWPEAANQREWAWWLMGCVAVYGLLPRLLLAALSAWRWRAGRSRLAEVDMGEPYVQRLLRRLQALEPPPAVIDEERRAPMSPLATGPAAPPGAPGSLAVVGFELPPEALWPPAGLPPTGDDGARLAQRIAGSAGERQALVTQLARLRPESLLLVVHGPASPDRGTARFVREAARQAGRTALLLQGETTPAQAGRWRQWLDSEGFMPLALVSSTSEAIEWIAKPMSHSAAGHG